MTKHSKLAVASLLLLAAAAFFSGCEDNGVTAPSGGEMRLTANPETVVIDVAGGKDSAQSRLTVQVFDDEAFALRGVSIFFTTTGGVVHTLCTDGACEQIGGQCNEDIDCALPITRAVETNVNGFANVELTLSRSDPEMVTVSAASGLLTQTTEVFRSEDFGNQPPVAVIDPFPGEPLEAGMSVVFDGSLSNDPDGLISCYQWEVGSLSGTEYRQGVDVKSLPATIYNTEQVLTVTLRVSDDPALDDPAVCQPIPGGGVVLTQGLNGTTTISYQIVCTTPIANAGTDFTIPPAVTCETDPQTLPGNVVVRPGPMSGEADLEFSWDCGDGVHSLQNSREACCSYVSSGSHRAELTVTNGCGKTSTPDPVFITVP